MGVFFLNWILGFRGILRNLGKKRTKRYLETVWPRSYWNTGPVRFEPRCYRSSLPPRTGKSRRPARVRTAWEDDTKRKSQAGAVPAQFSHATVAKWQTKKPRLMYYMFMPHLMFFLEVPCALYSYGFMVCYLNGYQHSSRGFLIITMVQSTPKAYSRF